MYRKATFHSKKPKPNSSDHNSRRETPKYLIETDPEFDGNYYEIFSPYKTDEQFVKLAKIIYNEKFIARTGQNQRMQKKQADALIWEVAISSQYHHTKDKILELFDMLRMEKTEVNRLKLGLSKSRLKPVPKDINFILPIKLKIKRKPKKENLSETGYHILEISEHRDEGYFERFGKWEGLAYYPTRDILLKKNRNWYIKSNELNENSSAEAFDILADMSEFKKVYNYHWHVKYTNFNLNTGMSAQFSKGEVSGEGRLKKVAEFLGMRYVPEEKTPFAQSVGSVKEQHHIDRQNKYVQLMMKFGYKVEKDLAQTRIEKREEVLAKKTTTSRLLKKDLRNLQTDLSESEETVNDQKEKIILLDLSFNKERERNDKLVNELEETKKLLKKQGDLRLSTEEKLILNEQKLHNKDVEIDKISKKLPKENETVISSKRLNELEVLKDKLDSKKEEINSLKSTLKNIEILFENEKVKSKELNIEITNLQKDVYSNLDAYINGGKTGERLTFKRLVKIRENEIEKLKTNLTNNERKIEDYKNTIKDFENIIRIVKDHNVSKEALTGTIDEIKEKVIDRIWKKKEDIIPLDGSSFNPK